jgi:Transposase
MKKGQFTDEQIIGVLREHEGGAVTSDVCRRHGSSATFCLEPGEQFIAQRLGVLAALGDCLYR